MKIAISLTQLHGINYQILYSKRMKRMDNSVGPGHNSFTVNENGEDVLIYHCHNYKEINGDPLYDPNRHTRAQVFHWNEDGTPNFGVPVNDAHKK